MRVARFLVALPLSGDLLLRAKHLLVEAMMAGSRSHPARASARRPKGMGAVAGKGPTGGGCPGPRGFFGAYRNPAEPGGTWPLPVATFKHIEANVVIFGEL
jgi:hypothetical protein